MKIGLAWLSLESKINFVLSKKIPQSTVQHQLFCLLVLNSPDGPDPDSTLAILLHI